MCGHFCCTGKVYFAVRVWFVIPGHDVAQCTAYHRHDAQYKVYNRAGQVWADFCRMSSQSRFMHMDGDRIFTIASGMVFSGASDVIFDTNLASLAMCCGDG